MHNFCPVIALVGRPNVGKSTLFNVLTKSRKALVADFPGLTRDRQFGYAAFQGKAYIVVDTGGMGVEDATVDSLMSQQTRAALSEAVLIFFMVDARAGLTPSDEHIAKQLRTLGKPVYVIVNKVEGMEVNDAISDFYKLGFSTVYPIAAAHCRGIEAMLTAALSIYQEGKHDVILEGVHIAVVGRPNVGKSTLINRILKEERVLVYDLPGTTRDSIFIPFQHAEKDYVLIDTAGVRRRARVDAMIEKFAVMKTLQAIQIAQVCVMLIDAEEGVTDQDLHLLGMILEAGKALVILVNKWDGLSDEHRLQVKQMIDRKLSFLPKVSIRFVSAKCGSGLGPLFKDIQLAYESSVKRFSTAFLTRLLMDIVSTHQPPLVKGRRIKLRYAHLGGHNPPTVVIHGNQLDKLPGSYMRYLSHALITHLDLIGTPIQFEYKNSVNPYEGKKKKRVKWSKKGKR